MLKQTNPQRGNVVVGLFVWGLIIWGVSSLFSEHKPESTYSSPSTYYSDPSYSSYESSSGTSYSEEYVEPENPYDEGTGHSAGYEWAEENDVSSCDGNSDSFIEGCEEYLSQQEQADSVSNY
ncbi:MAG: hypothetical protein WBC83_00305 [Minisyncoccia bacterium]